MHTYILLGATLGVAFHGIAVGCCFVPFYGVLWNELRKF
jgi:hypothetical protein